MPPFLQKSLTAAWLQLSYAILLNDVRVSLISVLLFVTLAACQQGDYGLVGKWREDNGDISEFTADGRIIVGENIANYELLEDNRLHLTDGEFDLVFEYSIVGDQLSMVSVEMSGSPVPESIQVTTTFTRVR